MGQGMTSNSPRRIFNKWESTGLPALKNANTDAVYIGDIKFGEELPAGTQVIGGVTFGQIASGVNVIGAVTFGHLPAGSEIIGAVTFGQLPAGTRNIGDVDILTIAAGETHIGAVGKALVISSVTALVSSASPYLTGQYAGSPSIMLEFAGAARVSGGKGCVRSAMIVDRGDQEVAFNLILFNTASVSLTTALVDGSPLIINDVDVADIIGVISCATADYIDLTDNQVAWEKDENIYFDLTAGTCIYGVVQISSVSWDPSAANDIGITLAIEQF